MANNRIMMLVAVVAGLLSMALAFLYLQQARSSIESEQTEPSERVLVATRDLNANTPINAEEDFTVKEVPAQTFRYLAGAAVSAQERNSIAGRRINSPIPAGMPLLYSHMTEIVDLTISPAARAMTIAVNQAGGLGGLLVPGDRVDVVVARQIQEETPPVSATPDFDPNAPEASIGAMMGQIMSQSMSAATNASFIAEVVVSNVKVLAVGQKLSLSRQQFMFTPENQEFGRQGSAASTVTLELTTDQALSLVSATGGGTSPVTLLLRGKEAGEGNQGFDSGFR